MEFNPDRCEVMHFGRSNTNRKYTVNSRTLKSIARQRDLGVQVHRSLKVAMQVEKVVKKAYCMLAFIARGIEFKNWQVMLQVSRTLFRPHLEYSVQFWSPHYLKDVEALERVQKRFTKMLPGMERSEEKLEKLGLFSLERRRLRGDLIEVYKIMRGMDRVDSQKLFPRWKSQLLGSIGLRCEGQSLKEMHEASCFTQRVELTAGGGSGSGYDSEF